MKNVHILPTEHTSRLYYNRNDKSWQLCEFPKYHTDIKSTHNIYITSDEEITVNDYITDGYLVWKWKDDSSLLGRKKVILSTDQDLIGVQAIDDEFLEWFVNNPSCEEVEVDYGFFTPFGRKVDPMGILQNHSKCVWKYKIIFPKEEQTKCYCGHTTYCDCGPEELEILETLMPIYKQETLEEAAENFWLNDESMTDSDRISYVNGFLACAKWQQEICYSENDMEQMHNYGYNNYLPYEKAIKQFKKK